MFGTLKEGLNYTKAVKNIRQHTNRTETFLESPGVCPRHFETFRPLSSVSRKKMLIVDDYEPIVEFLGGVFEKIAIVETAMDGEQALRKTKDQHFDVIISDVNMWGISGLEFYKRAVENDPSIGERFLFLTGFPKPETIDFFLQNNLRYITKPATVEEIKETVNEIIASA
jgi:YesN/AraC family two-component response regulator